MRTCLTTLSALCIALAAAMLLSGPAFSEPVARATRGGAVITLHTDPCEQASSITNLPFKAVWVEGQTTFQGCYQAVPELSLVVLWFEDRSVVLLPISALRKVSNT